MTQEITKARQNDSSELLQDDFIVLLCAPVEDGDPLTTYTSRLLTDLPSLNRPTNLRKFAEPLTYEGLLQELSIDPQTEVAVVFWGHGNESFLLGPPASSASADRTRFYDATFVDLGPKYMLAVCCSAAIGLTRAFDGRTDRAFIGFDRPIGFVLGVGIYAECWKKLVHGCAEAALNCKDVEELRTTVQTLYKSALSEFPSNSKHRYGLLMNAYLHNQLEGIDFVRT